MDKRRKPLSPYEQLLQREKMIALVAEHPEWEVPKMLKAIRNSLHLTISDMARIGKMSEPALRNIESGRSSPSVRTVDELLRPFGMKLAVVRVSQRDAGRGTSPSTANDGERRGPR